MVQCARSGDGQGRTAAVDPLGQDVDKDATPRVETNSLGARAAASAASPDSDRGV
jgi:hypothetical protein